MTDFDQNLQVLIKNLETILNEWEPIIESTIENQTNTINGEQVKYIIALSQEFLYTAQKVLSLILPQTSVQYRNSDALPHQQKSDKVDKDGKSKKNSETNYQFEQPIASFKSCGFKSEHDLQMFKKNFLSPYMTFTVQTIGKYLPIILQQNVTVDLCVSRIRISQFSIAISNRVGKATLVLYKLFPGAQTYRRQSVFDKNFFLCQLLNSSTNDLTQAFSEVHISADYETETNVLLQNGGVSSNSVKLITQQAKIIKDMISERIENLIASVQICPGLFCQNPIMRQIFAQNEYTKSKEMFRQLFEYLYGSQMLSGSNFDRLMDLLPTKSCVNLIEVVNVTDFLPLNKIFTIFERDMLNLCLDAVRKENARNYNLDRRLVETSSLRESINAQHLCKKVSSKQFGQRTLFIQTSRKLDFDFILTMHLFGAITIHTDSMKFINTMTTPEKVDCTFQYHHEEQSVLTETEQSISPDTKQNKIQEFGVPELLIPGTNQPLSNYKIPKNDKQSEKKIDKTQEELNKCAMMLQEYEKSNQGVFVTFESESEVIYLVQSLQAQQQIVKILNDKNKVPYAVSSFTVEKVTSNNLLKRLQSLDNKVDLLSLKEIVLQSYGAARFAVQEHNLGMKQLEIQEMITSKYLKFFLKLVAISVDGFKADRYLRKINDISLSAEQAQKKLQDEESQIMKGNMDSDAMNLALTKITNYLLQVETLINEKAQLQEKLKTKLIKWNQSDMIFKERKQTLVDLMKMLLTNVVKVCLETVQPDCDVYETALFMIDDIFIQNRIRSVEFMAEVQDLINFKKETLTDLGQTQIELASKIQFITEEQLSMKKEKDEMSYLMDLKTSNAILADELQQQELRISNLRKVLGMQRPQ